MSHSPLTAHVCEDSLGIRPCSKSHRNKSGWLDHFSPHQFSSPAKIKSVTLSEEHGAGKWEVAAWLSGVCRGPGVSSATSLANSIFRPSTKRSAWPAGAKCLWDGHLGVPCTHTTVLELAYKLQGAGRGFHLEMQSQILTFPHLVPVLCHSTTCRSSSM